MPQTSLLALLTTTRVGSESSFLRPLIYASCSVVSSSGRSDYHSYTGGSQVGSTVIILTK